MRNTYKCHICKEVFLSDNMVHEENNSGQKFHYCTKCYKEKEDRKLFADKVCQLFKIKTPGPRIWTERQRLIRTYGYTDSAIIACLDYIYTVEKKKVLAESLCLINPITMDKMKQYTRQQANESMRFARATSTPVNEYLAPIKENNNNKNKIEYNPDDWLEDEG